MGDKDEKTAELEAQQWEVYKAGRIAPLLRWWRCYFDDVSVFSALPTNKAQ